MPSPLLSDHGVADKTVSYWLGHYMRFTRGLTVPTTPRSSSTEAGEVQPDSDAAGSRRSWVVK